MKKQFGLITATVLACIVLVGLISACDTYEPEPVAVPGLTVHFFHNTEENWFPKSPALVSDKDELTLWKSNTQRYWDGEGNEIQKSELLDLIDSFTTEYFDTRQLLLIRFAAVSSGYRHKVTNFEYNDGTIFVDITQYVPGAKRSKSYGLTDDMAYWLAIIELETKYPSETFINLNGKGNGITAPKEFEFSLISDGTAYEVSIGESNASGRVEIPHEYKGLPVTRIGDNAFYGDTSLEEVIIPSSVTSIGYMAFYHCTWLEKVVLTEIDTIENHAFGNCKSLKDIYLPQSLISIGEWAFYENESLTAITIGSSVKNIGTGAFNGCLNLTTLILSEGIESIGASVFGQCKKITEIILPSTLSAVGKNAFSGFTAEQIIYVNGAASQSAADTKWGKDWRGLCNAVIIYE